MVKMRTDTREEAVDRLPPHGLMRKKGRSVFFLLFPALTTPMEEDRLLPAPLWFETGQGREPMNRAKAHAADLRRRFPAFEFWLVAEDMGYRLCKHYTVLTPRQCYRLLCERRSAYLRWFYLSLEEHRQPLFVCDIDRTGLTRGEFIAGVQFLIDSLISRAWTEAGASLSRHDFIWDDTFEDTPKCSVHLICPFMAFDSPTAANVRWTPPHTSRLTRA